MTKKIQEGWVMFRRIMEKHHPDWDASTIAAFRWAFFQGASWVIVTLGDKKKHLEDLQQEVWDEMEKESSGDTTTESEARH